MTKDTTNAAAIAADIMLFDNWFDPIEDGVRSRVRGFIETMLEEELDDALSRPRYGRRKAPADGNAAAPLVGCRHGHRKRALTGTFGKTEIAVRAAFKAVQSDRQVAVLVPTTILADQHQRTFRPLLHGRDGHVEVDQRVRGAGRRDQDVCAPQRILDGFECSGLRLPALREGARPLVCAVDHEDLLSAPLAQGFHCQLSHFPGAQHHYLGCPQIGMRLLAQLRCQRCYRRRIAADAALPDSGDQLVESLRVFLSKKLRLEADFELRELPHPSAQGLLQAAPGKGKGLKLADLQVAWEANLRELLSL